MICVLASLVLFGRLGGIFASESFASTCDYSNHNQITSIKHNYSCPLGIELNSFNYVRLNKYN